MANKKMITHGCLLLLLCILGGGILITLANYIPINENIKLTTMQYMEEEGLFPEVPSMQGGYGSFQSMKPTALELATDCLMLKMALYEGEGQGITQAFRCYSTQVESEYSRYWHGYVVILRILLLFFDYYEIRILNGLCQSFLLALNAYYIWKQKGKKYAMALISSYVLLMPPALAQCLQYSWIFYIAFGALLIYLRHRNYWETGNRYLYFFLLAGVATIYIDLLTYPLLTWGLLIIWWILLQENAERKSTDIGGSTILVYLKKVVFSAIAWILGYGLMWVGKWALGSVVLHENLFAKAFSEMLLWTVNEGEASITLHDRFYAVYTNWNTYQYKIYSILLLLWLLYWMIRGVISGYRKSPKMPALLLISFSSIVWYMVLAGHTLMHHIFTHRIYAVSIAAFFGMVLLSTEGKAALTDKRNNLYAYIAALLGMGVLSYGGMRLMKDEYYLHNGTGEFTKLPMTAPISMTFTPSFSEVTALTLGISFENSSGGYLNVQLSDQDTVLDQQLFSIKDNYAGNFHDVDVSWNLQAGHPYTLAIEPVGTNGEIYLWMTSGGEMPLSEYGTVTMENNVLPGQMLSGISYWCGLIGHSVRLFFTASFMGVCMMVFNCCRSIAGNKKDVSQ